MGGSRYWALLFPVVPAAVPHTDNGESRKRTDDKAGLIDLTDDVTQEDIMQKMPMDIVVKVAKEGRQEEITFHTWDFGGQEVYYVLHHLFITVRDLVYVALVTSLFNSLASRNQQEGVYCLCFDMREAKSNADEWLRYLAFWLNSAYSHVQDKGRCSIILVGTHRVVVTESAEHAAISDHSCGVQVLWFLAPDLDGNTIVERAVLLPRHNTKAVDMTGIADVLGTINVLAEEQVRVRKERPLSLLKVLDELQSLSETANYIYLRNRQRRMGRRSASADESMPTVHFDIDLWTIAQAHRVRVDHFDALVEFFDAVEIFKVCRSKRDKTGHHDVVVLRPQWLVNMFTAVTRAS